MSKKVLFFLVAAIPAIAFAEQDAETSSHASTAITFLWIAIILGAAKLSSFIERLGQPAVLGELLIGVVIGNLVLFGLPWFEALKTNEIIAFLAELGVVILLFQIGLESNIQKMKKVGGRALLVALVGVVVPFVLGTFLVGPLLAPGLSSNTYLFIGATLTATSVGITARVFQDLKKLQSPEAQIVLGAAVIDDVLGLIILAVVSAMVTVGNVGIMTIAWITLKAALFLVGSIFIGQMTAHPISKAFSKIHTGTGIKFTLAIIYCLVFAYLAYVIGLAPIVGAFAAGLVLDPVHFRYFKKPDFVEELTALANTAAPSTKAKIISTVESYTHHHVENLVAPLGMFLVPIFFVLTGMNVRLETLTNAPILLTALGITVAAFIGKICAGLVAGKANKMIVGVGMIPRGEVGLIFALMGKSLGVISDELYSALVIMVILSTLLTPPVLATLLRRQKAAETQFIPT
ncbi:MAG: cation:proton antiporter [Candidatus Kerfeldbacteria bacterium]|nr:cation:proton antiporter [Candidatus Kerfeldbacteria bacterium]